MLLYAGREAIETQYIVVDMKAAMARVGLGMDSPSNPDNELETIAWFRFPVSWTYLKGPEIRNVERAFPSRSASQISAVGMSLATLASPIPVQKSAVVDPPTVVGNSRPANSAAQWEMVIPKMVRPPSK